MKRKLQAFPESKQKIQKKPKRSDIPKDSFEIPKSAIKSIINCHSILIEDPVENNRALNYSYRIDIPDELNIAKDLLRTYGFVKFNLSSRKIFDIETQRYLDIDHFSDLFYTKIKQVFEDVYKIDISNEDSIYDGRRDRKGCSWPTSLNIGKIGPVHMVRKKSLKSRNGSIITNTIDSGNTGIENSDATTNEGHIIDPINQSIEAYYLKAYFCYDVFASLLNEKKLVTSVEPCTFVFPPLSCDVSKSNKSIGLLRNNNSGEMSEHVYDKYQLKKLQANLPSLTSPLTRLVYQPGVLSKCDNDQTEKFDTEAFQADDVVCEPCYDILKSNPLCGVLGITGGDCVSLVPGAHIGFDDLLSYMRKTRHTDKRTIFSSTPPDEFNLDQWLLRIPLNSSEILIYDRRIPTKIDTISLEEFSAKYKTQPMDCKPFIGMNVSFFPSSNLTKKDKALRSIAFMQNLMGSGLRAFGHVENTKRRGTPVIVNDEDNILKSKKNTTEDPLIRKIIGLNDWTN